MTDDPEGLLRPARALLSVSDKAGLPALAQALAARGVEIVSSGGTAALLRAQGVSVTDVAEVTGSPEMLGGRVKTLHPRIHGGILARRADPGHMGELAAHGILPFDLVVVNLYPFEAAVAAGAGEAETIEEIDIGGPAMIRAAAKSWADVAVVADPADYPALLAELEAHGGTTAAFRRGLALKAFSRTAAYDAAIAGWLAGDAMPEARAFGGRLRQGLRYGENPHQRAAFYQGGPAREGVATATQLQGKALSYNNLIDTDAAFELAAEFEEPACVIVKHATPCGVGWGASLAEAHAGALASDPVSAFGGIVAVNRPLDAAAAEAVAAVFTEVVIAPGADDGARAVFARKPNLRLLVTEGMPDPRSPGLTWRQVAGGFLVQDRDAGILADATLSVVTQRAPDEAEMAALRRAWAVVKHVRSNAIVIAGAGGTLGIGGGQTSRVDAVRQAAERAGGKAGEGPMVLASDAFFPFADGLLAAAGAGVTAVIQPGGSQRDAEVVAAADAHGVAMVTTALRHFRH